VTDGVNYDAVLQQMEAFGLQLRQGKDLPLRVDGRKHTCGLKGKAWYKLYTFDCQARGRLIVGSFGSYKSGDWERIDWKGEPLSEVELQRLRERRQAVEAAAKVQRQREADFAAASAGRQWAAGSPQGVSPYLQRKGVEGESCRYLPDGSLLVPLIRYDYPRDTALRGVQRIYPAQRHDPDTGEPQGDKTFTYRFDPRGCACRLGAVPAEDSTILVCEGYATGLTLRMATGRALTVFVALNAGNLAAVVELLRGLYPSCPILICGDDDWRTRDQRTGVPTNPGKLAAIAIARAVAGVFVLVPAFGAGRGAKDTDFNDLHAREGLGAVTRQLQATLAMLPRVVA